MINARGVTSKAGLKTLTPFAAVRNLLDERYIGSVSVNAGFGRFFEPAPGRNALLGAEIRAF